MKKGRLGKRDEKVKGAKREKTRVARSAALNEKQN